MNLRPYPEYKDSGVDWIGNIPDNWGNVIIGKLYEYRNDKVSDKHFKPLSVTKKGIVPQLENAAKTIHGDARKRVEIGDFVINSRSDRRGSCGVSEYRGSVSLISHVLKPRNHNFDNRFAHHLFRSDMFSQEFYKWGNGIVDDLWSTKYSEMKKIKIPLPSDIETNIIGSFLDKKTSEIDKTIEKDTRLIELLQEKRTALINHVVTKGLDPKAPMKDSGIEWIGEIPIGWETRKLKFLTSKNAQYGANEEPEKDDNHLDFRYVRITDVNDRGGLKSDSFAYLSKEKSKGFILNEGDVLFARSGATVGKVYYYSDTDGDCCFAGYMIRYVTDGSLIYPKFLLYYSLSKSYKGWIKFVSTQSTIENVSADKYDKMIVPTPTIKEQEKIADYLDKETLKIEKIILKIETKIELLQEYKKSLIHHVVTGKVDVRDVV